MVFTVLWSGLVSQSGVSHTRRVNLIVPFPLGQNRPRKIGMFKCLRSGYRGLTVFGELALSHVANLCSCQFALTSKCTHILYSRRKQAHESHAQGLNLLTYNYVIRSPVYSCTCNVIYMQYMHNMCTHNTYVFEYQHKCERVTTCLHVVLNKNVSLLRV